MKKKYYNEYAAWLQNKYGEKVYKLPINIKTTCPNIDGTLGYGGCIYCGAKGGGNETLSNKLSIEEQLSINSAYIKKRYKAKKFIAYFQSNSNTYLSFDQFRVAIESVLNNADIVGIAIATRPDCIDETKLEYLSEVQKKDNLDITIEVGLQTANYKTLRQMNRGHTLAEYIEASTMINKADIELCTHLIIDLPWDDDDDVIETAKIVSAVKSMYVKCHSLYIEKHTELEKMYMNGNIKLLELDDYIERCVLFLENLNPDIVIQRMIGRVPQKDSVIANWDTSWWKVRDILINTMEKNCNYQGRLYEKNKTKIRL